MSYITLVFTSYWYCITENKGLNMKDDRWTKGLKHEQLYTFSHMVISKIK